MWAGLIGMVRDCRNSGLNARSGLSSLAGQTCVLRLWTAPKQKAPDHKQSQRSGAEQCEVRVRSARVHIFECVLSPGIQRAVRDGNKPNALRAQPEPSKNEA